MTGDHHRPPRHPPFRGWLVSVWHFLCKGDADFGVALQGCNSGPGHAPCPNSIHAKQSLDDRCSSCVTFLRVTMRKQQVKNKKLKKSRLSRFAETCLQLLPVASGWSPTRHGLASYSKHSSTSDLALLTIHTAQNNSCHPIIQVIPHAQALILTSVTGSELANFRLINARLGH